MAIGEHYTLTIKTSLSDESQVMVSRLVYEQSTAEQLVLGAIDLISAFREDVEPTWRAAMVDDRYIRSYSVRCLEDPSDFADELDLSLAGTVVSSQAPSQAAPIISFRTGKLGRRFRGRTFFHGVSLTQITASGLLTGAAQTVFKNLGDDMHSVQGAAPATALFGLVIWSKVGGLFTPVISTTVPQACGSIRSRRQGVGE